MPCPRSRNSPRYHETAESRQTLHTCSLKGECPFKDCVCLDQVNGNRAYSMGADQLVKRRCAQTPGALTTACQHQCHIEP